MIAVSKKVINKTALEYAITEIKYVEVADKRNVINTTMSDLA